MIADAWKNEMPESHRIALDIAYSDFLDAYLHLSTTIAEKVECVAGLLPERFLPRYTPLFCHRFVICMSSVAERLVQPNKIAPVPRCTAEALALHILIVNAKTLLSDVQRINADYRRFISSAFHDTGFLSLYGDGKDRSGAGVRKDNPRPNGPGANLEFAAWFTPFDRDEPVNPFVYEDWTSEQSAINFYR